MNFVELCREVRLEAGIPGNGPNNVKAEVGALARVVKWVRDEWLKIQLLHETSWLFLRKRHSFNTVAGKRQYSALEMNATDFAGFVDVNDGVFINGTRASYVPWDQFYARRLHVATAQGTPSSFTLSPERLLMLAPVPNAAVPIEFEYRRKPQVLTENTDIPIIDDHLHQVIVHAALIRHAELEQVPQMKVDAEDNYADWLTRLENAYLPQAVW